MKFVALIDLKSGGVTGLNEQNADNAIPARAPDLRRCRNPRRIG